MSMARPSGVRLTRQRRSAVTRDRVAQVALELFNEQGYLPVTTNAIAEACGISTEVSITTSATGKTCSGICSSGSRRKCGAC